MRGSRSFIVRIIFLLPYFLALFSSLLSVLHSMPEINGQRTIGFQKRGNQDSDRIELPLTIDRFEGDWAILLDRECKKFILPSFIISGEEGEELILPSLYLLPFTPLNGLYPTPLHIYSRPSEKGVEVDMRLERLKGKHNNRFSKKGGIYGKGKDERSSRFDPDD